ncbi:winged helix DNA-binding protein [Novosphingobium umbonatum]|nr:winged helix DNA-binding protein [Novosphingobium umbonatum]
MNNTDPWGMNSNFSYDNHEDDLSVSRIGVSVFAERPSLRETMQEDVTGAGFRVTETGNLMRLVDTAEAGPALGDIVMVDCPLVDAALLAGLARLDLVAARKGLGLVISTSVDALDDVFAALDQSQPQILVAPSRTERLVALGQVMTQLPQRRVRELSDEDRLVILRLTQQITEIGEKLSGLSGGAVPKPVGQPSAFRFDPPASAASSESVAGLPDARIIRRIIRNRQLRGRFLNPELFADPAWDMLLDLTAAHLEKVRVSVTSLCIASGVPPTTALRWIGQMTDAGLLKRVEDDQDRRRAFIVLTDKARDAMAAYFAEMGNTAHRLV